MNINEKRFNLDAETIKDAENYLYNRAKQLLIDNITFNNFSYTYSSSSSNIIEAVTAHFIDKTDNTLYVSHYILKQFRGKNIYQKLTQQYYEPVITVFDCNIKSFLEIKNIPHKVVGDFLCTVEYKAIEEFYKDKKSKRSKLYYMNHIDEGLTILKTIGASNEAMRAFCLHPIVQNNIDFINNFSENKCITHNPWIMALAIEYRNVANSYLSPMRKIISKDIKLSPIKDVNDMLIADKIQNKKDFTANYEKYINASDLDYYFKSWFERLEISDETYNNIVNKLMFK